MSGAASRAARVRRRSQSVGAGGLAGWPGFAADRLFFRTVYGVIGRVFHNLTLIEKRPASEQVDGTVFTANRVLTPRR